MQLSVVNGVFGGMTLDESLKYLADRGVHQLELGGSCYISIYLMTITNWKNIPRKL